MGNYWFPAPPNPGLHVRNRYGYEVYRHAVHWLDIPGTPDGWQQYDTTAAFPNCEARSPMLVLIVGLFILEIYVI